MSRAAEWQATAVHEAAHALMSHLLAMPFAEVKILGARDGEVVPTCVFCGATGDAVCEACHEPYLHNDPRVHQHSREIEDALWRSAAVAVAGQIGEECVIGRCEATSLELNQDDETARKRSCLLHLRIDGTCYRDGLWKTAGACGTCTALLERVRRMVRAELSKEVHLAAARRLASELRHSPHACLTSATVRESLLSARIVPGSALGALGRARAAYRDSERGR